MIPSDLMRQMVCYNEPFGKYITRNSLETVGRQLFKVFVCHCLSQVNFNQSDQQWEAVVASNSYERQLKTRVKTA